MLQFLLAILAVQDSPQALQARIRDALAAADRPRLEALFAQKQDATYLFQMANADGGLASLQAFVLPAPPGWEKTGALWVTFHRFQDIQQHRDPIFPVIQTPNGPRLGKELPEWDTDHRTRSAVIDVRLQPLEHKADIQARLEIESKGQRAPVFRLNEGYTITGPGGPDKIIVARGDSVVQPKDDDWVRAGGLFIPWTKQLTSLKINYQATLNQPDHDKITDRVAYITAFWVPDLARLPYTTRVRITGPSGWVLRSEGEPMNVDDAIFGSRAKPDIGEKAAAFKCDVPISFPKVMGGAYVVGAERTVGRHTFRSFVLKPTDRAEIAPDDKTRAEQAVENMVNGMKFFEENLAEFPFSGYECFDGLGYYGIESYSHTLLAPNITLWAVTHEIGHTYFGGMAPCPYVRDTWNEGMTMYLDDVLFKKNMSVLQTGLETMRIAKPLSKMDVAWADGSATYYRGAYVMRMLEREIGWPAMQSGLRALVTERRGMDTAWADLRPIFERSSGAKLDWFWQQWIDGATYPTLEIASLAHGTGGAVRVTVRQSGTQNPFRLRFKLVSSGAGQTHEETVQMTAREQVFELKPPFRPESVKIDIMELAMARAGEAKTVR